VLNKDELKAHIEEEEKLLDFYTRYKKEIIEMTSEREWEIEVDECLERLNRLYRLLKG
jgi:hypothetical protein